MKKNGTESIRRGKILMNWQKKLSWLAKSENIRKIYCSGVAEFQRQTESRRLHATPLAVVCYRWNR